ncbi:hypothetical protein [Paenibacillus sp. MBLB4367]|uniref:hypothetical protein n=1 Tax=Paenibacillus sp. MBLB4367 TaxID=3384767 RepID=UPI003908218C
MATEVGAIKAKMELDAEGFRQGLQKAVTEMKKAAEESKKIKSDLSSLNSTLRSLGLSSEEIGNINQELKRTNPKILEAQLSQVEAQLKRLGASSEEIARVKNRLVEVQNQSKVTKEHVKDMGDEAQKTKRNFDGLASGLLALGAGASLVGLLRTVKSLVDEANKLHMSLQGLTEVSKALGHDVNETTKAAQDLAARGFMTVEESASALKTALATGYNLEESIKLINALADAAAYNREAHLGWGEAVVQAVRGIKQQESELTDSAGITTNLSVMWDRYARQIGKSASELTDTEKAQAALNGMMAEAKLFAGNADKAMQGYAGTQAQWNQTITTARQELGEAFIPVLNELLQKLTPIIVDFTKWVSTHKEFIAGTTAAAVAVGGFIAIITSLITVVAALRIAFIALGVSMGPIGIAISIISTVAAGVFAYKAAADAASESVMEFAKNQDELNAKLAQSPAGRSTDDVKKMQTDIDKLNDTLQERTRLMQEYDAREARAKSGQGSIENTHRIFELADQIKDVDRQLKGMDYKNVDQATAALGRMRSEMEKSVPALVAMEREELAGTAAKVQHIDKMTQLRDQYNELNKVEQMNEAQKSQLASVVEQLKREYPDMLADLDQEGRWHIRNIGIVNNLISAEKSSVEAVTESAKKRLEVRKQEAEQQLALAVKQIETLQKVSEAGTAPKFATGEGADAIEMLMGQRTQTWAKGQTQKVNEEKNKYQQAITDIKKMQQDLTIGNWDAFKVQRPNLDAPKKDKEKEGGKSPAEIAAEMRSNAFNAAVATVRFEAEMYNWSADQQIEAYAKIQTEHKRHLAETVEDERTIALQIKRLHEDTDKSKFEISSEWIMMEERRLKEKGAKEEDVAMMQLDAWERVRDRYEEDTEFYKRADTGYYNAKMTLIEITARKQKETLEEQKRLEKEAQQEGEKNLRELNKKTSDSIRDLQRKEIDALDARKRAIQDYYDSLLNQVDEENRANERKELMEEIEKYRYSTSKDGQEKLRDLEKQLGRMDADDKRRGLQNERDAKLRALDDQKRDIEAYYDEVTRAFQEANGDMSQVDALMQDGRVTKLKETNKKLLEEMKNYKNEYAKIVSSMPTAPTGNPSAGGGSPSSNGPVYGPPSPSAGSNDSSAAVKSQMQQNSAAWHSASDSQRRQLEAANRALGSSIGANYIDGTWYKNGTPLYHSGGIAGEMNFRSKSKLMPDELYAILRRGEPVLTPEQVASIAGGGRTEQKPSIVIHGSLISHEGDVRLEDDTDVRTYWNERELAAQRLLAGGIRDDG